MKKYGEFLEESLAAEAKTEPSSPAAQQAKKMGLSYVGFGRYADSKGQVSYIVDKDRLVPFKRREEVQSMYQKAYNAPPSKDEKGVAKANMAMQQADQLNSTLNKRFKEDQKITNEKTKEAVRTNKALMSLYKPDVFTPDELDAIMNYTTDSYIPINRYLYKGYDENTSPEDAAYIEGQIEALDSAFEGIEAPFAYTVYSGLSNRYKAEKIKTGENYIFRGYLSTSLDYNTAISGFTEQTDGAVVLQIEIQKGQKAIHLDGVSDNSGEMETLLPRGSTIQVISGPHKMPSEAINYELLGDSMGINLFHCILIEDK